MEKTNSLVTKLAVAGLFVCSLFAVAPSAKAQDTEARIGIKGGINLSNLYISDVNDQKAKWGVHAGLFAKIPVGAAFAVQPELLYTTAGNKVGNYSSLTTNTTQNQTNFNLNYIQLPILASITAGPISIQAGPYFSYLVNAKVKNVRVDNNGIPTDTGDGRELSKSDFNTIDYGLAGGVAIDVKGFQLGVRYNYGLRNVGNNNISGLLTRDAKNSVAQLYIALGL